MIVSLTNKDSLTVNHKDPSVSGVYYEVLNDTRPAYC